MAPTLGQSFVGQSFRNIYSNNNNKKINGREIRFLVGEERRRGTLHHNKYVHRFL